MEIEEEEEEKPNPTGTTAMGKIRPKKQEIEPPRKKARLSDEALFEGNPRTNLDAKKHFAEEQKGKKKAKIGRASCRERVCQYVKIPVVGESLKKKKGSGGEEKEKKKEK